MRVFNVEEAMEELCKGKRKRSLSATDVFSDDSASEDGQVASYASSVTLCAPSITSETATPEGGRLSTTENMLTSQQEIIHRLLSTSEAISPATRVPEVSEPTTAQGIEDSCEPCASRTSEDIYERARIEAGLVDHHEWNAAYIHGMVHIGGKRSDSAIKTLPCGPCAEANRFAVCVGLAQDDPYKELLHDERKICCGWCEYEKIKWQENVQQERGASNGTQPQRAVGDRASELQHVNPSDGEGERRGNRFARLSEFFVIGKGLDLEVVTAEIPLFLGTDSVVRPGTGYDDLTSTVTEGYYITAHRPPTSAMLADLRADSAAWQMEKEKKKLEKSPRKLDETFPGKQLPRYHTYCFQFSYHNEQAPE